MLKSIKVSAVKSLDTFSVLNYQGSKKALLNFIHKNISGIIDENSTILDIFSGTCSVGYSLKTTNRIFANDSEYYSFIIAKALLSSNYIGFSDIVNKIEYFYLKNISKQREIYSELNKQEYLLIASQNIQGLIELYQTLPTIWNGKVDFLEQHKCYELFTTYYSGTYFGIAQSIDIDSIRFAIEEFRGTNIFYALLTSLFYAMKECVFSKDGHMAQPLDPLKNSRKLLVLRQKNIFKLFIDKFSEFFNESFINSTKDNRIFNLDFEDLIKQPVIAQEVDFIYADPPYTDMQYSRYYHLLNVVSAYNYLKPSINNGNYTKGLYVEGRYQSKLSKKSSCLQEFSKLIKFTQETRKNIAISFAYPIDIDKQKTDRYVMDINGIINSCKNEFKSKNVKVISQNYQHSNNRNSEQKKVLEYLIICKGK